jgi:N-acetylglucosamine transport system substrate-binding protein
MVLVFVGCGKKTDIAEEGTYSGEVYPENGLPKDKRITIRAIYPVQGTGKGQFAYAVKTFEERFPNVKIDVRYIEAGRVAYQELINASLQSGSDDEMYDWVYSFESAKDKLIEQGKLEPQDEMWERSLFDKPSLKLKDIVKLDKREVSSPDGHLYALPSGITIVGLYYNKKLFKKYGWEEPKDWVEFMNLCAKIKSKGIFPLVMDGKHALAYFDFGWSIIPYSVGGEKYRNDLYNYEPNVYCSKAYLAMLERLEDFSKLGYLHPGTISFDHTQSQMEFLQGKAAMITNGTWLANEMKDVTPPDFEWGFMPFPGNNPGQKQYVIMNTGGSGYVWKNKPALIKQWVKEFNLWRLNLDIQKKVAEYGGVPIRTDFLSDLEFSKNISPTVKIALEITNNSNIKFVSPDRRVRVISNSDMAKLSKTREDGYVSIISGRKNAKQVANEINMQYMKALAAEKK